MNYSQKEKMTTCNMKGLSGQSGITLVVVMIILIAMTFLGLGAMSDSNLQFSMVKNVQLQNMAHSASITEVNAQIDVINSNPPGAVDQVILDVVQAPPQVIDGLQASQVDLGAAANLLLPGVLGTVADGLDQDLTLTQPNVNFTPLVEGYSISPDSSVTWLHMRFDSNVTINNTASSSNQTQGFRYISAN